jgi:6-phosphogluconolactonase
MITLTVADDAAAAARTSAERIATAIEHARAARGVAHVSLAGGHTPAQTYRLLAKLVPDWSGVHLWFGDERCVPLDDAESNHKLLADTLLAAPLDPAPVVHPLTGADRDPAAAAATYEQELRAALPGDPPQLDFALLGLGEDGHTASLFPENPALDEQERLCIPVQGTKPPFDRITLTLPVLRAARQVAVLAVGAGKAWAVGAMLSGPSTFVPASLLAEANVELIVDRDAAPAENAPAGA